jgi:hypothetical protein
MYFPAKKTLMNKFEYVLWGNILSCPLKQANNLIVKLRNKDIFAIFQDQISKKKKM